MRFDPDHARMLLARVDPGRVRSGRAVGLRDGAVLALIAAGMSAEQIAAFRASAFQREGRRVVFVLDRYGSLWTGTLPSDLGVWLLAWLTEAKIWGLPEPLFRGCRGPLTPMGIFKVFERYRNAQAAPAEKLSQRQNLLLHYQSVHNLSARPTALEVPDRSCRP